MRAVWKRTTLALCALMLPIWVHLLPVSATVTDSLFFNLNAGDPGSYSTSTPTVWKDLAGGRNGTIVGSLTYNSTTKALEFPGGTNSTNSNGYVDMGSGFNDFGTGITIEFEGHFGAVNQAWERIFDFGNGDASDNIWVGVLGESSYPNRLAIEIWHGNTAPQGRCMSADELLVVNTFAKWTITLDGTYCRMYKDGVEVKTRRIVFGNLVDQTTQEDIDRKAVAYSVLPNNLTRANNYIGRSNWGNDAAFNGAIKYVRIYTSALSSTDVENNTTTYTLTYASTDADSGTAPSSQTGNGLITLSGNTGNLTRAGYFFNGWTATQGGTTAITGSYNLTTNTTLHPVWIPIPSAPIISVSSASSTSLSVAISQPAINPSSVDGYQVETSTDGVNWSVASNNLAANASTYTISGLTTGTPYYVRVAAKYVGQLSAYGYNWQPIYEVTSPKRNSGAIVYADGFGIDDGDAATTYASTVFTRVRYRMAATYGGANNYVDADFSRTLGTKATYSETFDSLARARVPTTSNADPSTSDPNHFEIHANVSDLNVESNVSGVQNGKGIDGRLEIWPWNYDIAPAASLAARTSNPDTYDDSDSPILTVNQQTPRSEYGSFQLHRLSGTASENRTIFAWNRHLDPNYQDIGIGQYSGAHSDWTFAAQVSAYQNQPRSNFNLKIFIDMPVTPTLATYTISYAAGTGGSGTAPSSPTSVTESSTFTTPANTFTRTGYTFAGWSDGTATYLNGVTYPATSAVTGNVALTATWTANTLTVTLDEHGGSDIADLSTQTGGTIASSPGEPTRNGYTFNGWFTSSTGGTAITFPYTHGQTSSFTLHAQWTPVPQEQTNPPGSPTADTPPADSAQSAIPSASAATDNTTTSKRDSTKKTDNQGTKRATDSSSDLPITGEQIVAKLLVALMAIVGGSMLLWRRRLL